MLRARRARRRSPSRSKCLFRDVRMPGPRLASAIRGGGDSIGRSRQTFGTSPCRLRAPTRSFQAAQVRANARPPRDRVPRRFFSPDEVPRASVPVPQIGGALDTADAALVDALQELAAQLGRNEEAFEKLKSADGRLGQRSRHGRARYAGQSTAGQASLSHDAEETTGSPVPSTCSRALRCATGSSATSTR